MKRILIIIIAVFALLTGSSMSNASTVITSSSTVYTYSNLTFSNISQSSTSSLNLKLLDPIVGSGNTLQATGSGFDVFAAAATGQTKTLKNTITMDIAAGGGYGIGSIDLSHAGDYSLTGTNSGGTNPYAGQKPTASAHVAVTITINEVDGVAVSPLQLTDAFYAGNFSTVAASGSSPLTWNNSKPELITNFLVNHGFSSGSAATKMSVQVDTTLTASNDSSKDLASISDSQLNINVPTVSASSPVPVPASGLLLVFGAGLLLTGRGLRQTRLRLRAS